MKKPIPTSIPQVIDRYVNTAYDVIVSVNENLDIIKAVGANIPHSLKYLGAHTSPPSERLDGSELQDGDYYFNTMSNALVYFNLSEYSWFEVDPAEILSARDDAIAAKIAAELAQGNAENAQLAAEQAQAATIAYADAASDSADASATSALNAANSEANAANSENNAESYKNQAASSATDSSNSANLATTKANEAEIFASDANTYAGQAATSASAASAAQDQAEIFAQNSSDSADAAALSEANSLASANNSQNSATASEASAVRAEESAQVAELKKAHISIGEMEAMRNANKDLYAASGFVHLGKHYDNGGAYRAINQGLWVDITSSNVLLLGKHETPPPQGESKTNFPVSHIAGFISNILHIRTS